MKDYADTVKALFTLLPLLRHKEYKLFYRESESKESVNGLLAHSAHFHATYEDENGKRQSENFFAVVRRDGITDCLCYSSPYSHEFITNNFFELRREYKKSFTESLSINKNMEFIAGMESQYPCIHIKPDPCYQLIPNEIYRKQFDRMIEEDKNQAEEFFAVQSEPYETAEEEFDKVVAFSKIIHHSSHIHRHIDVKSKAGLLEFAKTGQLCDQVSWIPLYDKEERRIILEHIRDRNTDENDSYTLYITEMPMLSNDHHVFSYKDKGIVIRDSPRNTRPRLLNDIYIENKSLAALFFEYAETYIPANHALSKEETTAYLNSLIEEHLT
jgi:hypothetical protein